MLVGLPVSLSGEEGPQAAEVRDFVARLAERVAVPCGPGTSASRPSSRRRTPGRSSEDSRAAAHLLQGYLEAQA